MQRPPHSIHLVRNAGLDTYPSPLREEVKGAKEIEMQEDGSAVDRGGVGVDVGVSGTANESCMGQGEAGQGRSVPTMPSMGELDNRSVSSCFVLSPLSACPSFFSPPLLLSPFLSANLSSLPLSLFHARFLC